ncbi:hypothetical protein NMG60_11014400 [Bertholletia excelsa]
MLGRPPHFHRLLLEHRMAAAPPTAGGGMITGGGNLEGENNFEGNMVIILAALLCALVCALGLNSIVRCALRCSWRNSLQNPDRTVAVSTTGVKKATLRQIPVVMYRLGPEAPATETECAICLGEFVEGEKVRVLPGCRHVFHVKCIDKWLASHSSCPTCRQILSEHTCSSTNV